MRALYIPPVISRTTKSVDWLFDAQKDAQDEADAAAWDRREAIERDVSFGDLLEECCEFTPAQRQAFMEALARSNKSDLHTIFCLLDQAKESIVKRRLAGGE